MLLKKGTKLKSLTAQEILDLNPELIFGFRRNDSDDIEFLSVKEKNGDVIYYSNDMEKTEITLKETKDISKGFYHEGYFWYDWMFYDLSKFKKQQIE